MEFLRTVETSLRDLATEARRLSDNQKTSTDLSSHLHSIKASAEAGIVHLRSLQTAHSKLVRNAAGSNPNPTPAPQSAELVQPFLLSLSLLLPPTLPPLALTSLNYLLTSHAVPHDLTESLLKALTKLALNPPPPPTSTLNSLLSPALSHSQASSPASPEMLQLKTMQTTILLLNSLSCYTLTPNLLAELLYIPARLLTPLLPPPSRKEKRDNAKDNAKHPHTQVGGHTPTVINAANATFSQLISLLFDRIPAIPTIPPTPATLAAIATFHCLITLAEGPPPSPPPALNPTSPPTLSSTFEYLHTGPTPPRTLAFSILDMIISSSSHLFTVPDLEVNNPFPPLLQFHLCPLLTTTLLSEYHTESSVPDPWYPPFTLLISLMTLSQTILTSYSTPKLAGECHILVTTLLHFVHAFAAKGGEDMDATITPYVYDDEEVWYEGGEKNGGVGEGVGKSDVNGQHVHKVVKAIPNQTTWRAALALAILYEVAKRPHVISVLHAAFPASNSIVESVVRTLAEFVEGGGGGREKVMMVVEYEREVGRENSSNGGGEAYEPRVVKMAQTVAMTRGQGNVCPSPPGFGETVYLGIKVVCLVAEGVGGFGHGGLVEIVGGRLGQVLLDVGGRYAGAGGLGAIESFSKLCEGAFRANESEGVVAIRKDLVEGIAVLCLPREGGLRDFHTKCLTGLIHLAHVHGAAFGECWGVVFDVLCQLVEFEMEGEGLGEVGRSVSRLLGGAIGGLTDFGESLGDEEFLGFVKEIVGAGEPKVLPERSGVNREAQIEEEQADGLGGRLLAFAGRTVRDLAGGAKGGLMARNQSNSRRFGEEFRRNVYGKARDVENLQEVSFMMVVLVAIVSGGRREVWGDVIMEYLIGVCKTCQDARVRLVAVEVARKIVVEGLEDKPRPAMVKARVVVGIEDFFKTDRCGERASADDDEIGGRLLKQLMKVITESTFNDTVDAAVIRLKYIIEAWGQNLTGVWQDVIKTLQVVAESPSSSSSSSSSSSAAVNSTFQTLQLVVDDFLEILTDEEVVGLLACCEAFVGSALNINNSLSAIGMIWKISDQNERVWKRVLSTLIRQGRDNRSAVRNCAVNTLFSCVVGNGSKLELGGRVGSPRKSSGSTISEKGGWSYVFTDVVFVLLGAIEGSFETASTEASSGGGGASFTMHHSRDNPRKQWSETLRIGMQGLGRVMRQFMPVFRSRVWFAEIWNAIGQLGNRCVASEEAEIALAGVELLLLCVELASKKGGGMQTGLRAGDNMKVVNGRLQNVDGVGFDEVVRGNNPASHDDNSEDEYEDNLGSAEKQQLHQTIFLRAFANLDGVPASIKGREKEEDVLSALTDGAAHVYNCCASFEMSVDKKQSNEVVWVLDMMINFIFGIATRCGELSSSKYTTPAQKNVLYLLKEISAGGSSLAFETLSRLGGEGGGALQAEAARGISEVYGAEGVSDDAKISGLLRVLGNSASSAAEERERDRGRGASVVGTEGVVQKWRFGRKVELIGYGEGLLPVLRGGLAALERREEAKIEKEKEYEGEHEGGYEGGEEAAEVWQGVSVSVLSFLSPAMSEAKDFTQGVFGKNEEVVDIALAMLSVAMSNCPDREWKLLGEVLALAAKRSMRAARWYIGEGMQEEAKIELRVFSACVVGLVGGCVGLKTGGRAGLVELSEYCFAKAGKSGKLVKKLGKKEGQGFGGGGWLKGLSQRRESIEREVKLNGGGSFGLDDDEGQSGEESSDGESEGRGEDERRERAGEAHDFDCWCVSILLEEMAAVWVEEGDNRELEKLYGVLCGGLVGLMCVVESGGLKESANNVLGRVDFEGIVRRAEESEALARRVFELEVQVKKLDAQTWSLGGGGF